jgi:hypothetical protein
VGGKFPVHRVWQWLLPREIHIFPLQLFDRQEKLQPIHKYNATKIFQWDFWADTPAAHATDQGKSLPEKPP